MAVHNRNWSNVMTQDQVATTPRRLGRPRKNQINQHFPGTVIRFNSRPRLVVGDAVELCRKVLPGNIGKVCVVTGFDENGWVEVQSISGALDSRDLETNEITQQHSIHGRVAPDNCYRLNRELVKGYRYV